MGVHLQGQVWGDRGDHGAGIQEVSGLSSLSLLGHESIPQKEVAPGLLRGWGSPCTGLEPVPLAFPVSRGQDTRSQSPLDLTRGEGGGKAPEVVLTGPAADSHGQTPKMDRWSASSSEDRTPWGGPFKCQEDRE